MFPSDAITVKSTVATPSEVVLIPTTTTQITVLGVHLDKFASAGQMLQCNVNGGAPFTTLAQAVGTSSSQQDVAVQFVLPQNTICKLRTFDSTLTQGYITYVPRNIASTTMSSTTIYQNTYNQVGTLVFLLVASVLIATISALIVRRVT